MLNLEQLLSTNSHVPAKSLSRYDYNEAKRSPITQLAQESDEDENNGKKSPMTRSMSRRKNPLSPLGRISQPYNFYAKTSTGGGLSNLFAKSTQRRRSVTPTKKTTRRSPTPVKTKKKKTSMKAIVSKTPTRSSRKNGSKRTVHRSKTPTKKSSRSSLTPPRALRTRRRGGVSQRRSRTPTKGGNHNEDPLKTKVLQECTKRTLEIGQFFVFEDWAILYHMKMKKRKPSRNNLFGTYLMLSNSNNLNRPIESIQSRYEVYLRDLSQTDQERIVRVAKVSLHPNHTNLIYFLIIF